MLYVSEVHGETDVSTGSLTGCSCIWDTGEGGREGGGGGGEREREREREREILAYCSVDSCCLYHMYLGFFLRMTRGITRDPAHDILFFQRLCAREDIDEVVEGPPRDTIIGR